MISIASLVLPDFAHLGLSAAIDTIGRGEHFRGPAIPASDRIARAVADAKTGADCLFVPMNQDPGAVAELVAAVAPKPVSLVVHTYDDTIRAFAEIGGSASAAALRARPGRPSTRPPPD